jgi:hypothetical protein
MSDASSTTAVTGYRADPRHRAAALAAYAVALVAWVVTVGVPTDPFQMFAWLWLATIAWNVGAPRRTHLEFVRDWAPAFGLLVLYLYSRGLSDELVPIGVHWTEPVTVDRWLGGGALPTERLQDAWCGQPCTAGSSPRWYDVLLTSVYFTHFVVGLTVAVVLWLCRRSAWADWMRRYLAINFTALVVYVLYPMAPPWLASDEGHVGADLPRLTGRGWSDLGLGGFHVELASVGNPVAAMPSLHAGLAMLVAMYGIARLHSRWRWLLPVYPALMAVALVYYAEHYVVDIVAGWLLAAVVMAGCRWWERRRSPEAT